MRRLALLASLAVVLAPRLLHAETVKHDSYHLSFRVPADFHRDVMSGRLRDGVLWDWGTSSGGVVVEVIEGPPATGTPDDQQAKRILDSVAIASHSTSIERDTLSWQGAPVSVIAGPSTGTAHDPLFYSCAVDLPATPKTIRIRTTGLASNRGPLRELIERVVRTLHGRRAPNE